MLNEPMGQEARPLMMNDDEIECDNELGSWLVWFARALESWRRREFGLERENNCLLVVVNPARLTSERN